MNRYSVAMDLTSHNAGGPTAYYVSDDQCKRYNMPQRAVTLNFDSFHSASTVADLLNKQWVRFLRNPT